MREIKKSIRQGFTLVELMIVIVIVSVIVFMAVPNFRDYRAKALLREAMSNVEIGLNDAKRLAITWGRPVRVSPMQDPSNPAVSSFAYGVSYQTPATNQWGAPFLVLDQNLGLSFNSDVTVVINLMAANRVVQNNVGSVTFLPTGKLMDAIGPFAVFNFTSPLGSNAYVGQLNVSRSGVITAVCCTYQ